MEAMHVPSRSALVAVAVAIATGCFTPRAEPDADAGAEPGDASQPVVCPSGYLMTEAGACVDRLCDENGWCWENPLPVGGSYTIHGSSPDYVWATGGEALLEYDGVNWTYHPAPDGAFGTTPWVFSPTDVWVGFSDGIRHWNGHEWDRHDLIDMVQLLWASGPNDLWGLSFKAGEYDQECFHWDGQQFKQMALPDKMAPTCISGTSAQDVWIGGALSMDPSQDESPVLAHWDGHSWQESYRKERPKSAGIAAILAVSPTDVWAADYQSIQHFDGSTWSELVSPGVSPGSFYVVKGSVVVRTGNGDFQRSGSDWQALADSDATPSGLWPEFDPIFGTGIMDGVGIFRFESGKWNRVLPRESVTNIFLDLLWGTGEHIYAGGQVGWSSDIVHWDGAGWTLLPKEGAATTWQSISGTSPTDIYAIGGAADYSARLYHYDGQSWTSAPTPGAFPDFNGEVWGAGTGDLWFANSPGEVGSLLWHGDGVSWTQSYPEDQGYMAQAVFGGSSSKDVWISELALHHWDGNTMTTVPAPSPIVSIAAVAPDFALAVGAKSSDESSLLRWDGTTWQEEMEMKFDPSGGGRSVCTNGTDSWVTPGYHRDAHGNWTNSSTSWTRSQTCWVSTDGTVRLFGNGGMILKHDP